MYYLISIILGLIPEVLYFTLFLIYTKDLKEKRIKLGILITIMYLLCIFIIQHKILFYVAFMFFIFFSLKILYKKKIQIIDLFIVGIAEGYLALLSLLIYLPKNNLQYFIIYAINRILLFAPFIFRNKFNTIYKKYCSLWNRNYTKKQPIKSITLRNISLFAINIIILLINIIILYILKCRK